MSGLGISGHSFGVASHYAHESVSGAPCEQLAEFVARDLLQTGAHDAHPEEEDAEATEEFENEHHVS